MNLLEALRGSQAYQIEVLAGLSDGTLIGPDDGRNGLIVQAPPTNRVTLALGKAAVLDQGITLYPGGAPLVLSKILHGGIVCGEIRVISAVAAQTLIVWAARIPSQLGPQ